MNNQRGAQQSQYPSNGQQPYNNMYNDGGMYRGGPPMQQQAGGGQGQPNHTGQAPMSYANAAVNGAGPMGYGHDQLAGHMQQMNLQNRGPPPPPNNQFPPQSAPNMSNMGYAPPPPAMPPQQQQYGQSHFNQQHNWNANAAEFVPRPMQSQGGGQGQAADWGYAQAHNHSHDQSWMQQTSHAPANDHQYKNGVPSSGQYGPPRVQQQMYEPPADMPQGMGGHRDTVYFRPQITLPPVLQQAFRGHEGPVLMEVQIAAEEIMLKPDQTEMWSEAIVTRLSQADVPDATLATAVHLLVEMAISVTAVTKQLIGVVVSLCTHHSCVKESNLIPLLQAEHQQRLTYYKQNGQRLRSIALVLAEVYLQLKTSAGTRLGVFAVAMVEQIQNMLQDLKSEENVKWAATILQVCDKALAKDQAEARTDMLMTLARVALSNNYSENGAAHILAIVQMVGGSEPDVLLKEANQSLPAPEASASAPVAAVGGRPSDTGSAAEINLSDEERKFLEENFVGGILRDDSSSTRASEDDEVNTAYEQFLAKQNTQ